MTYEIVLELEPAEAGDLEGGIVDSLHVICEQLLLAEDVGPEAELTILLTGDDRLRALNREHRGVDAATDVLSFSAGEGDAVPGLLLEDDEMRAHYLGDVAISVPTARRQAAEAGLPLDTELAHLVVHGVLHLLGYDHETEAEGSAMQAKEEALLGPGVHALRGHEDA